MKEFEMSVSIDGQTNLLRTWGESVAHAIDNMILLSDVQDIYKIKQVTSGKIYNFNGDFQALRSMRLLVVDGNRELIDGKGIILH